MLAKAKEKGNQPAFTTTAIGTQPGYAASGSNVVRLTVPPSDPLQPVPVVRGAMPDQQKFEMPAVKPGYLPEYMPSTSPQGWQPPPQGQPAHPYYPAAGPSQYRPIGVQLGAPAYPQPAPVVPGSVSPVGFPR